MSDKKELPEGIKNMSATDKHRISNEVQTKLDELESMSLGTPIPDEKTCVSCESFRACKEKFGANWLSLNCAYNPSRYIKRTNSTTEGEIK